jgi:hypothetical protein
MLCWTGMPGRSHLEAGHAAVSRPRGVRVQLPTTVSLLNAASSLEYRRVNSCHNDSRCYGQAGLCRLFGGSGGWIFLCELLRG